MIRKSAHMPGADGWKEKGKHQRKTASRVEKAVAKVRPPEEPTREGA